MTTPPGEVAARDPVLAPPGDPGRTPDLGPAPTPEGTGAPGHLPGPVLGLTDRRALGPGACD